MIKYIFIISCFLFANPFNEWVNKHSRILNKEIKSLTFILKIHSDNFNYLGDSLLSGKVIVDNKKNFRFELGSRTIVSNGKIWKNYDSRTNQIILQKPDKKIQKNLFSLFKYNRLKVLPVKLVNDGSYSIRFFDKWAKTIISFYSETGGIKSIMLIGDDFQSEISFINLKEEITINLEVGDENTEIFDFR